jgi:cytochrome b561
LPESVRGYSPLSKWLHWIMAGFVLSIIPVGLTMTRLPSGKLQDSLFELHESFGATILTLACLRVAVRLISGVPEPYASLALWQRLAAEITHRMLYALIFIVPLLGWAGASAFGAPISIYGLFTLPPILAVDKHLAETLFSVHMAAAYLISAIVAVHIGAALLHGFIHRDGVLARMLPDDWGGRLIAVGQRGRRRGRRST